jgi:hypothetical protein
MVKEDKQIDSSLPKKTDVKDEKKKDNTLKDDKGRPLTE